MIRPLGMTRLGRWLAGGLALLGVLIALSWLTLPYVAGERAGLLEDDSYFYAEIAFHAQRLGMFSFDGLHPTSGFHPLWAGLLAAIAQVVGWITQDKAVHLSVCLSVWFAIVLGLAWRVGATWGRRAVFVGLALLTAPLMETALLSLLLVLAFERIDRARLESRLDARLLLFAFLVPLTRVDAAPILAIWMVATWGRRTVFLSLGWGLALGLAAHFTFLQLAFGHWATVSSLLKADGVGDLEWFRALRKFGLVVRTLLLLAVCAWGGLALRFSALGWKMSGLLLFFAPISFSLVHVAVSDVRSWYFLPGYAFAFLAGDWAQRRPRTGGPPSPWLRRTVGVGWWSLTAVTLLLSAYKVSRFAPLNEVRQGSWTFVQRANRVLPRGARVYQIDGSGFTGYWLEAPLINGDGLVNTYDYAQRMKSGQLEGYFEEQGICYVITDAPVTPKQQYLVDQGGSVSDKATRASSSALPPMVGARTRTPTSFCGACSDRGAQTVEQQGGRSSRSRISRDVHLGNPTLRSNFF